MTDPKNEPHDAAENTPLEPDKTEDQQDDQNQPATSSGCLKGCLVLFAAIAAIAIALSFFGSNSQNRSTPDYIGLSKSACQDSVKAQLKNPASAEFADMKTINTGSGEWESSGTVYSTNSFGATVSTSFHCKIEKTGEGAVSARSKLFE